MQERESEGCKWEMRVKVEKENDGDKTEILIPHPMVSISLIKNH